MSNNIMFKMITMWGNDPTSSAGLIVMVIGFLIVGLMGLNSGPHPDSGRQVKGLTSDESRARQRRKTYKKKCNGQPSIKYGWRCWSESYSKVMYFKNIWSNLMGSKTANSIMNYLYENAEHITKEDLSGVVVNIKGEFDKEETDALHDQILLVASVMVANKNATEWGY